MLDCAWCGMPVEIVTRWKWKATPFVTARCLTGHWYGGPEEDLCAASTG